jgi:hypothetical protein
MTNNISSHINDIIGLFLKTAVKNISIFFDITPSETILRINGIRQYSISS